MFFSAISQQINDLKQRKTMQLAKCGIEQLINEQMIYMLLAGKGSVHMVKNCDRGLENTAFSRLRSQFFTIRTDPWPVNNIFISF